ncbi:MAG: helix-turn-helix domain-containing protein [Lachnospiraceae bacterium]|nr:helix-turn-helix domain-containing protein [Lachnospiraceae bacterium]
MINIFQKTPGEINRIIAQNVTNLRKRKKISQKVLSQKSGVSYGSIRRFENEGEISLTSLTKIAIALGVSEELEELFSEVPFDSIQEVINGQSK